MGLVFSPDNSEASFASLIRDYGDVVDHLKLEFFMLKRNYGFASSHEKFMREKDRNELKKYDDSVIFHLI